MSVLTSGGSGLTLTLTHLSGCAWGIIPNVTGTAQTGLRSSDETVSDRGNVNYRAFNAIAASPYARLEGNAGQSNNALGAGFTNNWAFSAYVWDSGTLRFFYRLVAGTTLTQLTTTYTTASANFNVMSVLWDGANSADPVNSGGRVTSVKQWSTVLTQAQLLAESYQRAPVVTAGLTSYLSCQVGSTIGQDQSGNGNNWAIHGSGLSLDSNEPNTWPSTASSLFFGAGP